MGWSGYWGGYIYVGGVGLIGWMGVVRIGDVEVRWTVEIDGLLDGGGIKVFREFILVFPLVKKNFGPRILN